MDIDQSLEDLIKSEKSSARGRGGRGRGGKAAGGARGRGGRASRGRGRGGSGFSAEGTANKHGRGGGGRAVRGRGRGAGGRATRGRGAAAGKKPAQKYVRGEMPDGKWSNDMFGGGLRSKRGPTVTDLRKKLANEKPAALSTGTKIRISNLDTGVTAADMKELFEKEGRLKKVVMTATHCDVTFVSKADAVNSAKKYNGVTLDGMPMKISVVKSGIGADK